MPETQVDSFIRSLPSVAELRSHLAKNLHERDLLRRILRIAEQREKVARTAKRGLDRGEG